MRVSLSLSLSLSVSLSFYLSLPLSFFVSLSLSLCPEMRRVWHLYLHSCLTVKLG